MRDVKVFLTHHYTIPKLKERLLEHGIKVYQQETDCDTALVIYGDFANPMAFKNKKVLAYHIVNNNEMWNLAFSGLFKPVLEHYYDEFIDLSDCTSFAEIGDKIAEEAKRLENETD